MHLGGPERLECLELWPGVRAGLCESFSELRRGGRKQCRPQSSVRREVGVTGGVNGLGWKVGGVGVRRQELRTGDTE